MIPITEAEKADFEARKALLENEYARRKMTESPFLPDGRQWAWNSSSLEPAKACARKYYYQIVRGLRSRAANDDIIFGSHYAKAIERYHSDRAQGAEHDTAVRLVVKAALIDSHGWQSDNNRKTRETLIRSIVWYLDHYEHDPCQTVILANGAPAVELSFRFQLREGVAEASSTEPWLGEIWLTGHIDRLVTYAGETYIQDQKSTGSSLGSHYFNRYAPSNQMSLYTIAAQIVYDTPAKGVMIDAAQIAVGFTAFERGFTFRTPDQNEEWLRDVQYHIEKTWEAGERGWPMNDAACMLYGGCEFRKVCSKSPAVREEFLATGYVERRYSPL